jgi:metal-dependent amidase/aminoacylase/carboxypeptidase family protein
MFCSAVCPHVDEATHIANAFGVAVEVEYDKRYPTVVNTAKETELCHAVAESVVGSARVETDLPPSMASEDFAFFLRERPGCYVWIGNGTTEGGCLLHSPRYDFNDEILETGTRYWINLVKTRLS